MKKRISFFALAAIIGFVSCDFMGPEALFLQDQPSIGPIESQETDPVSGEICPDPWMDPWMIPWMTPDSSDTSDTDPDPETDSTDAG